MRFWKQSLLFYLGGSAYMTLEFLWRGRSHSSMFLLGGSCFLVMGQLNRRLQLPLAAKLLVSAGAITTLELLTGLLVNRDFSVWDYRRMPYHYLGQICLNYSLLWIPVSFGGILLFDWINGKLSDYLSDLGEREVLPRVE